MEKQTTFENPTGIQTFNHELFGAIRTMTNERGETFFVGKDVALALGYRLPQKAVQEHVDAEDVMVLTYRAFSKTEKATLWQGSDHSNKVLINESGLYSLILSSQLPSAKVFKRWVTSEVLPQIRRTGGYIPIRNARTGEVLTAEEIVDKAMSIMQKTISRENLPADDCFSTSELAKLFGMETKELYHLLLDCGILKKNGCHYELTDCYVGRGYDGERTFHSFSLEGRAKTKPYLVWTPAGKEFIESIVTN